MSLVENGRGMGLYHLKVVEKEIAEGRLKTLSIDNEIWVGADAILRTDAPEHPSAGKFISLVRESFKNHN
jgi:hypothetical protein